MPLLLCRLHEYWHAHVRQGAPYSKKKKVVNREAKAFANWVKARPNPWFPAPLSISVQLCKDAADAEPQAVPAPTNRTTQNQTPAPLNTQPPTPLAPTKRTTPSNAENQGVPTPAKSTRTINADSIATPTPTKRRRRSKFPWSQAGQRQRRRSRRNSQSAVARLLTTATVAHMATLPISPPNAVMNTPCTSQVEVEEAASESDLPDSTPQVEVEDLTDTCYSTADSCSSSDDGEIESTWIESTKAEWKNRPEPQRSDALRELARQLQVRDGDTLEYATLFAWASFQRQSLFGNAIRELIAKRCVQEKIGEVKYRKDIVPHYQVCALRVRLCLVHRVTARVLHMPIKCMCTGNFRILWV